jgi:hypothetical protein
MRARPFCMASLAALSLAAQEPPALSPEEQTAWIAASRQQALDYTQSLPDFLCTEVTHRYSAPVGQGPEPSWKLLDTLSIRLSYFDRKEAYRVIRINDKPADKNLSNMGGWTTKGDFGSMLRGVFDPKSQTAFSWDRWDTWEARRVAVFAWRLDRAHASFTSVSHSFLKTVRGTWGAKGLVYLDANTRQVLRLLIDSAEMPAESPTQEVHIVLEYGFQKIAGREYLLPARSQTVSIVKSGKTAQKSDSEFTDYKKFSADTKIEFGTPGEAK